jgi:flagellar biosynthetic protein FlhB
MHLQWFAAEDEGRTEEPTEHKIRKAREEGKVAKSAEVASSVVLLFAIITIAILGPYYMRTLREMMSFFLGKAGEARGPADGTLFPAFLNYFIRLLLPLAAVSFAAAILGNVVQFGFLFSVKPITPDLNRIMPNFSRFVKKALLSTEALFNLVKSVFKVLVIGLVAFLNIRSELGPIMNMIRSPFLQACGLIAVVAFKIMLESAIILLFLSLIDFYFQKRQHIESLKMSKQEVIEERKTYEGDPLVRGRLRRRMRELLSRNMIQSVPKADVVVTNPTHFAVALEYKNAAMEAPMVTAKGQDHIAENIKRIALENEVPIIENKPLARALHAEVEIGDVIPVKYYEAVATVLRQVYAMNDKGRKAG